MENNTKIAIGLAAAVVVGYIVYKSSKPKNQTQSGSTSKCKGEFAVECNDGSCDVSNGIVRPCLGKGGGVKGGVDYTYINSDEEKDNKGRSPYMPEVRPSLEDDARYREIMLKLGLERSQAQTNVGFDVID